METRQLKTFLTLCELKNYTHTAEQLGYAQSTVSFQVQALEKEYGIKLFEKLGKNLELTTEGRQLMYYAKRILSLEKEMTRNVSATSEIKGVLHLGVAESLCYHLLPQILETFKKQFPLVSFKILFGDALTLPTMLQNNDIDLGLSLSTLITKKEILILSKHFAHLDLLVQPNHPLSHTAHLTLKDLEPYPFFLTERGCSYRSELLRVLNQYNVFPTIELETNSKEILKAFTMHSMGITFLPELTVFEELKAHKLVPLDCSCDAFDIWLQLIVHKDKPINLLMQTFIDYFTATLSHASI